MIQYLKNLFSKPVKHEYDLDNPILDHVKITEEHEPSGSISIKNYTFTGFKCKNCSKVLWVDKKDMKFLPPTMKYGCPMNKKA